jgi:hypothetical protein
MYEIAVVVRVGLEGEDRAVVDRYRASIVASSMEEAAVKNDLWVEIENTEVEWIGEGDEPPIACWCGSIATVVNVATDAGPAHPACDEHVEDGYTPIADLEAQEELDEALGLL